MTRLPRRVLPRRVDGSDGGFTLIELLVVLVIIPIIIGGMAEALLVSFDNESATSNRISDTVNAQLTQDYFVRDVQGASYITTCDNNVPTVGGLPNPCYEPAFLSISPQVCSPGSGSLLAALYHPAEGSGSALDVAYWTEGSGTTAEIDRYSCTLNSTTYTSTVSAKTVIANPPPGNLFGQSQTAEAISVTTEIDPTQFASGAAGGWTQAAAFTEAEGFSGGTLTVASTAGFANGTITVGTTQGLQSVACTVASSTTFSCAPLTGVTNGGPVTQSSISSFQIAVNEPASSYKYSLLAAPRAAAPQQANGGPGNPTLLTLGPNGIAPIHGGGGASCPDGTTANICIGTSGGAGVVVDNGTVSCSGGGSHHYIWFQGGSGSVDTVTPGPGSCTNVTVTGSVPSVPDPLQSQKRLPNNGCFAASLVSNTVPGGTAASGGLTLNPLPNGGNQVPGVYTSSLSGTLEPGIYVVEGGIGTITGMATPNSSGNPYYQVPYNSGSGNYDSTAGVLLFAPGPGPYLPEQGCFTFNSSMAINGSISGLVPLDPTQSGSLFAGDKGLGGVWIWQDGTNVNSIFFNGFTNGGLMYAPSAQFNPGGSTPTSWSTGTMIVGGINDNGTHLSMCLNWTYTSSC